MKQTSNNNVDQLLESMYQQLASFRSASERITEYVETGNTLTQGWRTVTVDFEKAANAARDGVSDVMRESKNLVTSVKSLHDATSTLAVEIKTSNAEINESITRAVVELNHRYSAIDLALTKLQTQSSDVQKGILDQHRIVREALMQQREQLTHELSELSKAVHENNQQLSNQIESSARLIRLITIAAVATLLLSILRL